MASLTDEGASAPTTAADADASEPYKLRMSVPPIDVSVIEWLKAQRNPQQSLRQLIRESIQRDGFTDVYYKPVEQLPRRGRPPGDTSIDNGAQGAAHIVRDVRPGALPEVYSPDAEAAVHSPEREPDPEPEPVETAPVEQAMPEVPAAPEAPAGQVDMDSIFSQRG